MLREDTEVLEEDGKLGAGHAEVVHPDADVECFLGLGAFVQGQRADVATHSPTD